MKKVIFAFGLLSIAQVAQAQQVVFACHTKDNKQIEVQKINDDLYEYRYGTAANNELTIRNRKADLLARSSKWTGTGRGRWAVMAFQNGDHLYNVSVNFDSIEHTTESGVLIERKGAEVANVSCTAETAKANFEDKNFAW